MKTVERLVKIRKFKAYYDRMGGDFHTAATSMHFPFSRSLFPEQQWRRISARLKSITIWNVKYYYDEITSLGWTGPKPGSLLWCLGEGGRKHVYSCFARTDSLPGNRCPIKTATTRQIWKRKRWISSIFNIKSILTDFYVGKQINWT